MVGAVRAVVVAHARHDGLHYSKEVDADKDQTTAPDRIKVLIAFLIFLLAAVAVVVAVAVAPKCRRQQVEQRVTGQRTNGQTQHNQPDILVEWDYETWGNG